MYSYRYAYTRVSNDIFDTHLDLYVCIYIYMYTCIHIHVYAEIHICIYIYIYVVMQIETNDRVFVSIYMYKYMHMYTYILGTAVIYTHNICIYTYVLIFEKKETHTGAYTSGVCFRGSGYWQLCYRYVHVHVYCLIHYSGSCTSLAHAVVSLLTHYAWIIYAFMWSRIAFGTPHL